MPIWFFIKLAAVKVLTTIESENFEIDNFNSFCKISNSVSFLKFQSSKVVITIIFLLLASFTSSIKSEWNGVASIINFGL